MANPPQKKRIIKGREDRIFLGLIRGLESLDLKNKTKQNEPAVNPLAVAS
jgi:hypothetical protein